MRSSSESSAPRSSLARLELLFLQSQGLTTDATHALHQADWLLGRLAGRYGVTDENNALKLGYDPVQRCWPEWLDALDLNRRLLPRVVPPGQVTGMLDDRWRQRWGFSETTVIVSGTERNMPTGPSTQPQKTKERNTTRDDSPRPRPRKRGSTTFPTVTLIAT